MKYTPLVYLLFCMSLLLFCSCKKRGTPAQPALSTVELEKVRTYVNTELDMAPNKLNYPEIPENLLSDSVSSTSNPYLAPSQNRASERAVVTKAPGPGICVSLNPCTKAQKAVLNLIDENIHKSIIFYRQAQDSTVKRSLRKDLVKQRKDREKKVNRYLANCHDCK